VLRSLDQAAGVLYVPIGSWPAIRPAIEETYAQVRAHLRPETPIFAKALAPGLGLAEDPADGMSFGISRSGTTAEGLWDAFVRGVTSPAERLAVIEERFASKGLSLATSHLNPGSTQAYAIRVAPEMI